MTEHVTALIRVAERFPSIRAGRSAHSAQAKRTRKASRGSSGARHGSLWQECAAVSGER